MMLEDDLGSFNYTHIASNGSTVDTFQDVVENLLLCIVVMWQNLEYWLRCRCLLIEIAISNSICLNCLCIDGMSNMGSCWKIVKWLKVNVKHTSVIASKIFFPTDFCVHHSKLNRSVKVSLLISWTNTQISGRLPHFLATTITCSKIFVALLMHVRSHLRTFLYLG